MLPFTAADAEAKADLKAKNAGEESWLSRHLGWAGECLESSLSSRYMRANLVYLLYTCMILHINWTMYPAANDAFSDDDYYTPSDTADTVYRQRVRSINQVYVAAAVIHLLNALQYIYVWFPLGYGLLSWVMIPEYLNIIGALLYLITSTKYNETGDYTSPTTMYVHRMETAAAVIEVFAAFGWCATWWGTFPRGPGRGLTLDDPDFHGNVFIVVPSFVYMAYNIQILKDPSQYGANLLYEQGDTLYFVGALFYILAALRDDGWYPSFWVFGWLYHRSGAAWVWKAVGGERLFARCNRGGAARVGGSAFDKLGATTGFADGSARALLS